MAKFTCTRCGKPLAVNEPVFFKLPLPAKGFTEIQANLKLTAQPYCTNCVQVKPKD
ncbi:hypothetical protein [Lactiplantibacillus mudanjiangensis]|uniref:Fe3+ hydroxamate ABC transporter substrate-binding protein n=1 Tax=Lactiplantibacillus mudanjiangensis TaxID=1296538 RepID=A0A660DYR9_9LACO|nr:hypothetical protein [Lactiplantibacillus mudanjiangensis]VDG23276.1 hypothetical protein MUDAN_IGPPGNFN_01892 [Lactiplantibacillus mudanjiangensis]VDG28237.1 hypothetical protein MUDAN_MDHGFNIF_00434 [Lactiplantibacillus mudanjiangensis]VDG32472.1 hypothetical protein MUDAN_DOGOELCO_01729 [Lactiplantibacillus mudanjiangensis]